MAGQLIQHRVYISGIEVPAISVNVSSIPNAVWQGSISCPWSPFLMKLPKGTKITVFRRNSDIFDHFRLLFDGCLVSVTETKAWKGDSSIMINVMSDGAIFSWRKMSIIPLEMSFSKENMNMATQSADSTATTTMLDTILSSGTSMFVDEQATGKDACKAAAFWLTGIPTDGSTKKRKYYNSEEGRIESEKKPHSEDVSYLSPFMQKFYKNYLLQKKVTYVPLPQILKDAIVNKNAWDMMTKRVKQVNGMVTYWEIATYITSFFQGTILSLPDATFSKKGLAEIIIMPHNFFGRATLCNIIFPDQVLEKSNTVNYGAEQTRAVITGQALPITTQTVYDGLYSWSYTAPRGLGGTLTDLNLDSSGPAGIRSNYEEQYGLSVYQAPLDQHLVHAITQPLRDQKHEKNKTKKFEPPKILASTLNHEFLIGYSQKYSMTVRVQPDVEVVPGSVVIILDEEGEHTVAFCAGVSYAWNANGQAVAQIQLAYPHHHSWDFSAATHLANPLSDDSAETTTYETLVGSAIPKGLSNQAIATKYFDMWRDDYNRDSRQMKYDNKNTQIIRKVCTMEEFVNFMGGKGVWNEIKNQDFESDDVYTTLGAKLIYQFDSTPEAAALSTAKYSYWDQTTKESILATPYQPEFLDIGKPGDIIPSTYISGIVDCHLKWLLQIGHAMSI